ncbi:MAG: AtpZ/AtpI family protein [Planctomycetales bacterium]
MVPDQSFLDPSDDPRLADVVGPKEQRKLRARREHGRGAWFGLGMFGLVGWSVAVPTLMGIALGIWLDENLPVEFSWTLTGLGMGVAVGCSIAWQWVRRESGDD